MADCTFPSGESPPRSRMPAPSRWPSRRSLTTTLSGSDRVDRQHGTGAGSGAAKLLPRKRLQCYSVACGDMPHLEFGDKIVLPPQMLLELQCLKIPTPLLFQIQSHNPAANDNADQSTQYCSVQEFSAPESTAYVPYWMMQRLLLEEGEAVVVASVVDVPRGTYCRLQPESTSFLSLAADIGPKILMESALRRYSVLSVDATIFVEYGNERFYLRVVELKPAPVVSLCGDVDLETDFTAPENSDLKRPRSQEERSRGLLRQQNDDGAEEHSPEPQPATPTESTSTSTLSTTTKQQSVITAGVSVIQSATAQISAVKPSEVGLHRQQVQKYSLQRAQQRIRERKEAKIISTSAVAALAAEDSTAMRLRRAQLAFNSVGHRLVDETGPQDAQNEMSKEKQSSATTTTLLARASEISRSVATEAPSTQGSECPLCLAVIPDGTRELHTVRCARNPAYHKFECSVCHERITNSMKDQHVHCSHCTRVLSSAEALRSHENDAHTLSAKCRDCDVMFSRDALSAHCANNACSHAFKPCAICGLAYKRKDMAAHVASCANRTDKCELCQRFVKVAEMATHICIGGSTSDFNANDTNERTVLPRIRTRVPDSSNNTSNAAVDERTGSRTSECPYCCKAGFKDAASVQRHVSSECRIAQSFSSSQSSNNQGDESDKLHAPARKPVSTSTPVEPMAVRELLQGRLRRKDDAARIVRTRFPPINSSTDQVSSDASSSSVGTSTKNTTSKSTASVADTNPAGRVRAPAAAKKAPELVRTSAGNAAGNHLSVRSAACVLSVPVAPAKRQPRGQHAPS